MKVDVSSMWEIKQYLARRRYLDAIDNKEAIYLRKNIKKPSMLIGVELELNNNRFARKKHELNKQYRNWGQIFSDNRIRRPKLPNDVRELMRYTIYSSYVPDSISNKLPLFVYSGFDYTAGHECLEMKTLPMEFDIIKEYEHKFKKWFSNCRSLGFSANSRVGSCGMHIHLDGNCISDKQYANMAEFFENNYNYCFAISGRKNEKKFKQWVKCTYESYDDCYSCGYDHDPDSMVCCECNGNFYNNSLKDMEYDHYAVINRCSNVSVEIRLFASTIKYDNFMAAIEWCLAIAEIAKTTVPTPESIFEFAAHNDNSKELYKYLDNSKFYEFIKEQTKCA